MTSQQLAVLNALVTYAAENIPGGLSDDESEVAKVVGRWAIKGKIDDEPPPPSPTVDEAIAAREHTRQRLEGRR